jgi:uncharacterized protein
VVSALGVAVILSTSLFAAVLPPAPSKYVTDKAGVLPAATVERLNKTLADFERETSNQVLVYVDHHIPDGVTLEEIGAAALNTWQVGQKGKNNGVILFVFVDDRKARIAAGDGLADALSNATSQQILDDVLRPHFRAGDYERGIDEGVQAMMKAARAAGFRGTGKTVAETRRSGH